MLPKLYSQGIRIDTYYSEYSSMLLEHLPKSFWRFYLFRYYLTAEYSNRLRIISNMNWNPKRCVWKKKRVDGVAMRSRHSRAYENRNCFCLMLFRVSLLRFLILLRLKSLAGMAIIICAANLWTKRSDIYWRAIIQVIKRWSKQEEEEDIAWLARNQRNPHPKYNNYRVIFILIPNNLIFIYTFVHV